MKNFTLVIYSEIECKEIALHDKFDYLEKLRLKMIKSTGEVFKII